MTELQQGADIRKVTLGQLATHTSGLLLPQDHPPWPTQGYTLPEFIRVLAAWTADKRHQSGRQHLYTHAGFILLHLALERHFRMGIGDLLDARVLKPLGMADTTLPTIGENGRTLLPLRLRQRSVQGYSDEGEPVGAAGDVQGYYHWPGTAQMYSSARDIARFLAANLGDFSVDPVLEAAMRLAQRGVFPMSRRVTQGLAWEVDRGPPLLVDKNGGLNNATTYSGKAWRDHSRQSRQQQRGRTDWQAHHAQTCRTEQRAGARQRNSQLMCPMFNVGHCAAAGGLRLIPL